MGTLWVHYGFSHFAGPLTFGLISIKTSKIPCLHNEYHSNNFNIRISMDIKKLPHAWSSCAGIMLIEILGHYAKTPHFRDTLWKTELTIAQIIVWFPWCYRCRLYEVLCYMAKQIICTHHGLYIGILYSICVKTLYVCGYYSCIIRP